VKQESKAKKPTPKKAKKEDSDSEDEKPKAKRKSNGVTSAKKTKTNGVKKEEVSVLRDLVNFFRHQKVLEEYTTDCYKV
jgi:hypothetical protein